MVEKRELATLFKIERISEDFEQIIPFCVVEGVYDIDNYTFTTTDGTVYLHIEETEFPNFGYANKQLIHNCQDDSVDDINNLEDTKKKKLENELKYKYIRFISQKEKIYQKSKDAPTSWVMKDSDSRKYKEEMETLKEDAEDLIKYGLKRELIGRFPIKVQLNTLTKEIFREIMLESDKSELLSHINFLKSLGVSIVNLDDIIDLIIDDAISKEIGARGLVETISKLFLKIIYEVANNPKKYCEVKIGPDILNNPNDFELIERKTKKRTKKKNN